MPYSLRGSVLWSLPEIEHAEIARAVKFGAMSPRTRASILCLLRPEDQSEALEALPDLESDRLKSELTGMGMVAIGEAGEPRSTLTL